MRKTLRWLPSQRRFCLRVMCQRMELCMHGSKISCRKDCTQNYSDWHAALSGPSCMAEPACLGPSQQLLASEKSAAEWGAMKAIIMDEWRPLHGREGSRYKRHCDATGVTTTVGGLQWHEAVQQAADAIGWTVDKFRVEMDLEMRKRRTELGTAPNCAKSTLH